MALAVLFMLATALPPTSLILASPDPRPLTWSSQVYGPDGPWQAVQVQLGSAGQPVDAYPAGVWESLLFAPEICNYPESGPTCFAQKAGVFDPASSTTAFRVPINPVVNETFFGTQLLTGDGAYYFDTLTIPGTDFIPSYSLPNFTTFVVTRGYRTLPNGTIYSAAVGNIALGAEASNMTFPNGSISLNGSLLTGYLADHGLVPSSSFGLHIGSASLRIPGSAWLGGYDQFRIVGPVSAQSYSQASFPIDLLDISLGVAVGQSPFNTSTIAGLLSKGNSSLAPSVLVQVDSKEPYLYLPESTCQAIAAWLPVTYDADLGLYLWNTKDPQYERIVSSPAYLGFTFRLNNAAVQNMTIKVPFALLNLSLTEPLAHTPTSYFPCSLPTLPNYRLGRSFLQAAFMGVNWMTDNHGVWFLAQAPGPNIASQPQVLPIGATDNTLQQSEQTWEDTWRGVWTPIAGSAAPTVTSGPEQDKPHQPSTGLIVGVTVIGVLAVIAAVIYMIWRKRRKNKSKSATSALPGADMKFQPGVIGQTFDHHRLAPRELHGGDVAAELAGHMPGRLPTKSPGFPEELLYASSRGQTPMSPLELDAGYNPPGGGGTAAMSNAGRQQWLRQTPR